MSNIGSNILPMQPSPFSNEGKDSISKNSGQWLQKGTIEYDQIFFYLKSCLVSNSFGARTTLEVDFGVDTDNWESSGDGYELDSVEVYLFRRNQCLEYIDGIKRV